MSAPQMTAVLSIRLGSPSIVPWPYHTLRGPPRPRSTIFVLNDVPVTPDPVAMPSMSLGMISSNLASAGDSRPV